MDNMKENKKLSEGEYLSDSFCMKNSLHLKSGTDIL